MKQFKTMFITVFAATIAFIVVIFMPTHIFAGVKKDVRWIIMADETGPYSGLHSLGMKAGINFVKWANETNYIPGVNIIIDKYDHGSDLGKGVSAYQLAVSKKLKPILSNGGFSSPMILALKPLAKRRRIPLLDGSAARNVLRPAGWAFSMQPSYEGSIGAAGDWIIANWKPDSKYAWIRKNYERRKPRFAIIGWDNAFGRGFDQKEGRDYLRSKGVDFVGAEYIPVSPSDTSAQVLRLVKDKKADFIYFGMYPSSHAVILKDAQRLGLRDKFQDIAFCSDSIALVNKYAKGLGEGSLQLTIFNSDPNTFKEPLKTIWERSGYKADLAGLFINITGYYDFYSEVTRRAIKKVGIDNIDGRVIYDVLMEIENFTPMGYLSSFSFSKTKLAGPDTLSMYQIQNGKLVLMDTDIYVPDILPGGKDVVN